VLKQGSLPIGAFGDGADLAWPAWKHVAAFLGVTFGLTWLVDLAMYLHGGLAMPGVVTVIQLQMLVPACSAVVLGWRLFPESPLYDHRSAGRARWFYHCVLLLTTVYVVCSVGIFVASRGTPALAVAAAVSQVAAFLGVPVLLAVQFKAGHARMARVGLAWGRPRDYALASILAIVLAFGEEYGWSYPGYPLVGLC
jgi:hypothetical protein